MEQDAIRKLMRADLIAAGLKPEKYLESECDYSGKYAELLKQGIMECPYAKDLLELLFQRFVLDNGLVLLALGQTLGDALEAQIDRRAKGTGMTGERFIRVLFGKPSAESFMSYLG